MISPAELRAKIGRLSPAMGEKILTVNPDRLWAYSRREAGLPTKGEPLPMPSSILAPAWLTLIVAAVSSLRCQC